MGERPNVHAENLLSAGRRFGDAMLARDKAVREWSSAKKPSKRQDLDPVLAEAKEAHERLESAARAYATRMRRKRP